MTNEIKTINGLMIDTLVNGPFMENCFIAADESTQKAIVIDPGDEEDRIYARVQELSLDVQEIVNTHGHIDHAGAVASLKRLLSVPFAIHASERDWLINLPTQSSFFGLSPRESPEIDRNLVDGEKIQVGSLTAEIIHTPGHTPGGCCIFFPQQKVLFAGDTLFEGSVGRTDLPGGSMDTLLQSIKKRLLVLEDEVIVFCGHGPATTIGAERENNPFL